MNRSSFCVPVSAGKEYEIKGEPIAGTPEIKIWWVPLAGTAWALDPLVPLGADLTLVETAQTAGFLYGYIDCPPGAHGTLKLQSKSDRTLLDTLSAASAQWSKPNGRWIPANSVMLPVASGASYQAVKEITAGTPAVKLFWTAIRRQ